VEAQHRQVTRSVEKKGVSIMVTTVTSAMIREHLPCPICPEHQPLQRHDQENSLVCASSSPLSMAGRAEEARSARRPP
jgi:hypothetical protein